MDWTERHRPRGLREVIGNGPVLAKLMEWAQAWQSGTPPARRGLILAGPPGTGKTSTALALARDMGWQAIELNASDARNAETIRKVATAGAVHATFGADGSFAQTTGASKLIILDEADNLYERAAAGDESGSEFSDRGGKAAILDTLRQTRQPILLIVNDLYALEKGSGAAFKSLADVLKFTRVQARSVTPMLVRIAAEEGITVDKAVLEAIALRAEGDVRSAVRDLESVSLGRTKVTMDDLASLGKRDNETSLFDLMRHILKGRPIGDLQREVWSADATPEDLVLWVDENMPREYKDPKDLVAGYEMLSRADMFLGRTRKTQDYGLWAYASELSTLGVSAVRKSQYHAFNPFGFPQYLMRMSRTRGLRQTKDMLADHLGRATHVSKRRARSEMVEPFTKLYQHDVEFAKAQTAAMELTDEEVVLLLGDQATAARIKEIRATPAPAAEDLDADAEAPAKKGRAKATKAKTEPAAKPATRAAADDDGDAATEAKAEKPKPAQGQKSLFGF